jgi:hypothetical protein
MKHGVKVPLLQIPAPVQQPGASAFCPEGSNPQTRQCIVTIQ